MKRRGLLTVSIALTCGLAPSRLLAQEMSSQIFSLDVRPILEDGRTRIAMELRNISGEQQVTYDNLLPWSQGLGGARLLAYAFDSAGPDARLDPLRSVEIVGGPILREVSIPVDGRLIGFIDLADRFPAINDVLRDSAVAVFWGYQPTNTQLRRHPPIRGAVFFQKRR